MLGLGWRLAVVCERLAEWTVVSVTPPLGAYPAAPPQPQGPFLPAPPQHAAQQYGGIYTYVQSNIHTINLPAVRISAVEKLRLSNCKMQV